VFEYPVLETAIHGAVVKLSGRYPETGRVMNEKVWEIGYVVSGQGKLVVKGKEIEFSEGDQLLIRPGEKYFWEAKATLFMPCTPAWSTDQHKEVD